MSQLIEKIFEGELTQQGLENLKQQYPKDLKLDMTDDEVFKTARKTRTERNKLTEAINRRRIDICTDIKGHADSVIEQVNDIYDVVCIPFEAEDKRRKEEAQRIAKEREEKLDEERKMIADIALFYDKAVGQTSDEISGIIQGVDLIEVDIFDKELIHDAIEMKKITLEKLDALLASTKRDEEVEVKRKELEEQKAKADAEAVIVERLNNLKMIPSEMFGKTSADLHKKIKSLESYEITTEEFGDSYGEANASALKVIGQLKQMAEQTAKIEALAVEEAEEPSEAPVVDKAEEVAEVNEEPAEEAPEEVVAVTSVNPFHDWFNQVGAKMERAEGESGEDFKYRLCNAAYNAGVDSCEDRS